MGTRSLSIACLAIAACRVPGVDLTGKSCPCPSGWYCAAATNTCTRTPPGDGPVADVPVDALSSYRAAVLADTPMAYWRLGDTGSTARDELGMYDGTYTMGCMQGVAGAIAGDPDTAVAFDGKTCEVMLPDAFGFPATQAFSVEAWIDVAGALSNYHSVFAKESRLATGSPIDGYDIVESAAGMYFERYVNQASGQTKPVAIASSTYTHVVGVYTGSSVVLYVDGQAGLASGDTAAMPTFSAIAIIGSDLAGNYFHGSIDEVAVYGYALPADRILLHHDLGVSGTHD